MILWMFYCALIAVIVAAAARAAEWLARVAGYRVRWIWAGALVLTVSLAASAVFRESSAVAVGVTELPTVGIGESGGAHADVSWRQAVRIRIENVRRSLSAPLDDMASTVYHAMSPAADLYAVSLSLLSSL